MPSAARFRLLPLLLALAAGAVVSAGGVGAAEPVGCDAPAWNFDLLARRAEQAAAQPYAPSPPLPADLQKLDYDGYRMIAFEHAEAIWKGSSSPFVLECFHRGYLFADKVDLNVVLDGRPQPLPYERKLFQYRGKAEELAPPADLGFAGVRMLGKFETSQHLLEIASFLGASYFRAIGEGQFYGTSARGLAIDVGMVKAEEFPVFRAFWIERPAAGAKSLRVWALLDSPSVAGAYRIDLKPGVDTVLQVKARLFFRRTPEKVGLAPLTSMWMWGAGREPPPNDPRPKVHDADGLMVRTDGDEWIWRPLVRLGHPSLCRYDLSGVRGFGLLQRDRRKESFRDDEAKYHLRPSVWIEPAEGWTDGAVELLELPAEHEGIDNVAAWWKPNKAAAPGVPWDLEYTVGFRNTEPRHAFARAVETRVSRPPGGPIHLEVDFEGGALAGLAEDAAVECDVQAFRGEAVNVVRRRIADGKQRISFDVLPAGAEPVELRARLVKERSHLTESWRYLCPN